MLFLLKMSYTFLRWQQIALANCVTDMPRSRNTLSISFPICTSSFAVIKKNRELLLPVPVVLQLPNNQHKSLRYSQAFRRVLLVVVYVFADFGHTNYSETLVYFNVLMPMLSDMSIFRVNDF